MFRRLFEQQSIGSYPAGINLHLEDRLVFRIQKGDYVGSLSLSLSLFG